MTVLLITGTGSGVGKTVATAGLAAAAAATGLRVAVIKPAQTGIPAGSGMPPDAEIVRRLAGPPSARTLAGYPDALAPAPAARECGAPPLAIGDVIDEVSRDAAAHDVVLVEGTGGLLAPMGHDWTIADLIVALGAPAVVVVGVGPGTLNHTALTLEALARRSAAASVVIGGWPADPDLVHWSNLGDLPGDLAGVVPEGAATMRPAEFRAAAPTWFVPRLFGRSDPQALRADGVAPVLVAMAGGMAGGAAMAGA